MEGVCGMLVCTLDSRHEGSGSNPTCARYICPSARHFIHIAALDPGVKWVYPVGCEHYLLQDWALCASLKWRLVRMLLRESRRCTISVGLILNPVTGPTGVIINAL